METLSETHPIQADTPKPRLLRMGDILGDFLADGEQRYKARQDGRSLGVLSGFRSLDDAVGGALAPGLHILHGAPGAGKTAFALQMACVCDSPAVYISCEMSPLVLFRRILARVTDTYLGRFTSGELSPEELYSLARRGIRCVPHLSIMDATQAAASAYFIREVCTELQEPTAPLLIVVDSLHSWAGAIPSEAAEYERLQAGLKAFKQISAELTCPIIVIAERNRSKMDEGGQNAAAGSRGFEYISESVMSLDRDATRTDDGDGFTPLVLKLAKNRHGEAGKQIPLRFEGRLQRFEEVF